jgi:ABC-2 type transport system ATP-binding protein
LFQRGRIALMGAVADLARQVLGGGFAVEVEATGVGLADRLAAVAGVRRIEAVGRDRFRLICDNDVRPEAARAVVNGGGALRQLSVDQPSLDAIYAHYFQAQDAEQERVRNAA